ncbi:hypothetical protein SNEBB_009717 [Seison nebaliae]|nr:hypothetical protein SNEBB_009717 [Seison nebaliae]
MFKKFVDNDNISTCNQMKRNDLKTVKEKIIRRYPILTSYMNIAFPKREVAKIAKCTDHIEILCDFKGNPQFFRSKGTPFIPTLQLLHQYPQMMTRQQVDKGAIKFVISGANIMCPGLTSTGAKLEANIDEDEYVAIMAEGKEHAMAIGRMRMSSEKIQEVNKGIAIDLVHYLNDGLWRMSAVK